MWKVDDLFMGCQQENGELMNEETKYSSPALLLFSLHSGPEAVRDKTFFP